MTDKQPEALEVAAFCDGNVLYHPAATMLRTQHAEIEASNRNLEQLTDEVAQCRREIERKDALLRQALEMLGCTRDGEDDPGHRCWCCDDYVDRNGILRAALRKELAK